MKTRNPQKNAAGTIDLEIEHPTFGWIPFTASPDDTEAHGRELYAQAVAGDFGPIAPYVAPPPPPPFIPTSVTMRQARLALLGIGMLDDVDAALAAIPDATQRKAAQIEWEYAQTVDRHSPLVSNLSAGLGLDDIQLDNLFTLASTL